MIFEELSKQAVRPGHRPFSQDWRPDWLLILIVRFNKTGLENRDNRACANPQNYIFTLHLYSPSKQKNSGTDLFQDSPFKLLLSLVTCVVERGPRYKWFLYIQITSSEGPSPIYVHLREVSTWRREKSCHTIGRRAPKVTVDWSSNWHLSGIGTRGGPGGGIIRLV